MLKAVELAGVLTVPLTWCTVQLALASQNNLDMQVG